MSGCKTEFLKKIESRKLILFGAGVIASRFIKDFGECFKIDYCISNDASEKEMIADGGYIYNVFEARERLKDYEGQMIVLCANAHEEMEEQLFYWGFRYGEHYIDSEMFRCLISSKKIALVYGVCYMRSIHECLKSSNAFLEEYEIAYKLSYRNMRPHEFEAFSFILSNCDLYLYNSALTQEERMKNELFLQKLPKQCRRISVPILCFAGYHPQTIDAFGKSNKYCVVSKKTDWATFLSPDCNINEGIEVGLTVSEIINNIKRINFYDGDYLKKNYQRELRRLELAEMTADIIISDFIKENKGKKRLFYNETHISNEVILVLTKRILKFLGLNDVLIRKNILDAELLHTTEVPIYPSVVHGLDLTVYEGDDVKYRMFTFNGLQDVTFDEYVKYYYYFCKDMKKNIQHGFFPEE